jgi:methylated-DNA-[protein]-cysteine S-methyltransferase
MPQHEEVTMCAALWTARLQAGLPGRVPPANSTSPALAFAQCAAPVGTVQLAATQRGVCAVAIGESEAAFRARLGQGAAPDAAASQIVARAAAQVAEYFAGRRRVFDAPLDLTAATAFDRRVLVAIAAIPYGETRTYGALARALGQPGAARAVGRACGRNPVPLLIPCHRVLRGDGGLGGYGAGGPRVKAALLALERAGAAG